MGVQSIDVSDEVEVILECYRWINVHLKRLSLNADLAMWKILDMKALGTDSNPMFSLVYCLPSSISAQYDSAEGAGLKRRGCIPGTQLNVVSHIHEWASKSDGEAAYWLSGVAGTGKTTIAYTVCQRLQLEHKLAASFFCSNLRRECKDANIIFPSIAYQLAWFSFPFMSALAETLKRDPDVHSRELDWQFEHLLAEPLKKAQATLPDGLLVVIDALDECEDRDDTRRMLELLLSPRSNLPIRFIVLSRPEPEIRDKILEQPRPLVVLHELAQDEVRANIKEYLQKALAQMDPSDGQIDALTDKAATSFNYAVAAVQYIWHANLGHDPNARLGTILSGSQGQRPTENRELDQLYMTILDATFGKDGLTEVHLHDMQQVLFTVICAREAVAVNVISELLQIHDVDRVRAALRSLRPILQVVEASNVVVTMDASFPAFMLDLDRSQRYHCKKEAQHLKLAKLCFNRIKRAQPQLNICGLESSFIFDRSVPNIEDRVAAGIPPGLLYACRYWAAHVHKGNCASNVAGQLRDFLSTRLLLWMEVMILNNQMRAGVTCMRQTVQWCEDLEGEQGLARLAQDAKLFVEGYATNPVSRSTPHIYLSMLAFWPRFSPMAKHYAKYARGPVEPEGTALTRRQMGIVSTWTFEQGIQALELSPDGSSIALALGEEVLLVDSSSGAKQLRPLKGHSRTVHTLAFSPDGAHVFAGSPGCEATILGWEIHSGDAVLGPLQLRGHTDIIGCIGYSSDCTRIATGSRDKTARLWDAQTGKELYCWSTNHGVYAVLFSPDGTQLVVGSDNTLQVWNTTTGETSLGPITHPHAFFAIDTIPIPNQLRFLSTSRYYKDMDTEPVSAPSDAHLMGSTLFLGPPTARCVWDSQMGKILVGPVEPHTNVVTSVAFTSDGSRFISACAGGVVCAWDIQYGINATGSTITPTNRINCVKFSADGKLFISGSEQGTICTWDACTGEMRAGPFKAHTCSINAVAIWQDRVALAADDGAIYICDACGGVVLGPLQLIPGRIKAITYSPDGQIIVTGSWDGVYGWNARHGGRVFGPLTGLDGQVVSVQFSPDGTRIVASSRGDQSNIAVWDIATGQTLFGTLDAHRDSVRSVSYSPNGALIASGSDDSTIILWDAYTGKKRLGPLTEHSDLVHSVHFSPDSTRLVSGSSDGTIRIWDVHTGKMMFELLHGHERGIKSVEYSPDGTRILSRSNDARVLIHNARSPAEMAPPGSNPEVGKWKMFEDGWVVDSRGSPLVWVPAELRESLLPPEAEVMAAPRGCLRLRFDKSRMGAAWTEGYKSSL